MIKAKAMLMKKIYNTNERIEVYFEIECHLMGEVFESKMEINCD